MVGSRRFRGNQTPWQGPLKLWSFEASKALFEICHTFRRWPSIVNGKIWDKPVIRDQPASDATQRV